MNQRDPYFKSKDCIIRELIEKDASSEELVKAEDSYREEKLRLEEKLNQEFLRLKSLDKKPPIFKSIITFMEGDFESQRLLNMGRLHSVLGKYVSTTKEDFSGLILSASKDTIRKRVVVNYLRNILVREHFPKELIRFSHNLDSILSQISLDKRENARKEKHEYHIDSIFSRVEDTHSYLLDLFFERSLRFSNDILKYPEVPIEENLRRFIMENFRDILLNIRCNDNDIQIAWKDSRMRLNRSVRLASEFYSDIKGLSVDLSRVISEPDFYLMLKNINENSECGNIGECVEKIIDSGVFSDSDIGAYGPDFKIPKNFLRIMKDTEADDLATEVIECASVKVNDYEIIRKLGQGAFKKVYLAESRISRGRLRALKYVSPSPLGETLIQNHFGGSFEKWLEAELGIIDDLDHIDSPYVVRMETPIRGHFLYYYLVEEPFEKTLKDMISNESLDLETTLRIALQITEGLSACHSYKRPIIHKDLKPNNVGIDSSGNVKLTDFENLGSISMDLDSRFIPNTNYSPPELLEKGKIPDEISNIWSVGLLIYEMITGEKMFLIRDEDGDEIPLPKDSETAREKHKDETIRQMKKVSQKPYEERLEYFMSKFPNRDIEYKLFAQIVANCISYEKNDRYQTIDDAGEDLQEIQNLVDAKIRTEAIQVLQKYKQLLTKSDYEILEKEISSNKNLKSGEL